MKSLERLDSWIMRKIDLKTKFSKNHIRGIAQIFEYFSRICNFQKYSVIFWYFVNFAFLHWNYYFNVLYKYKQCLLAFVVHKMSTESLINVYFRNFVTAKNSNVTKLFVNKQKFFCAKKLLIILKTFTKILKT